MSKQRTVIVLLALVLTGSNPALAQDAAAQEAQQAESRRELEARQAEVQRARAEMEQARRQLEEAARTIATQVQVLPDLENLNANLQTLQVDLQNGFGNRARIGASVVDAEQGALVTQVTSGSGAEAAGLKVGDVIQSVNGTSVSTAGERPTATLREGIRNVEPGETVALVVERAGRTLDLEVATEQGFGYTVFSSPRNGEWVTGQWAAGNAPAPVVISPPGDRVFTSWVFASSPWGDMELVAITEGLGRYFDTSEGLLVVRAPQDDAIDIRDGDVILSISGRAPNSPEHAVRILSSFEPGETVELSLMRDGRRETVSYEVPERSAAFWQSSAAPGSAAPAPILPPPVPTPD
jgi:C-terminal processing protease CtpA/Prc